MQHNQWLQPGGARTHTHTHDKRHNDCNYPALVESQATASAISRSNKQLYLADQQRTASLP